MSWIWYVIKTLLLLCLAMIGKQFKCNRDSVPFFVDWFASNANVDKALEIFDKHVEQEGEEEEVFRQFVIVSKQFYFLFFYSIWMTFVLGMAITNWPSN